jgi:hypothetical protein
MKIAAFNVENLFDRARAFNEDSETVTNAILAAASELNGLFEKAAYSDADLARMRELIIELGLDKDDRAPSCCCGRSAAAWSRGRGAGRSS